MNKLRIGVFMGGKSIEKEVSFNSGRTACDHLDPLRYQVIPIFQKSSGELFILPRQFLYRGKISDFEHRLDAQAERIEWDDLKKLVDFVFIASHGRYSEDGALQGALEVLKIPYLGTKVFSSALGMDKIAQKHFLRMHNVPVPRDIVVHTHELSTATSEKLIARIQKQGFDLPCIVKPYKEGSSLGITIVKKADELLPAIHKAASIASGIVQHVLIEEKITGLEFTSIILTDYATGKPIFLPPTEIVHDAGELFTYEQKYMPGKATKFTPARCDEQATKKIHEVAWQATQALGITNISRIDGFLTNKGEVVIIDPNTLTGMAPSSYLFEQGAEYGMNHRAIINHIIETELHNYGMLETVIAQEQGRSKSMEKKMRVAVLFAGASNEREISLESGRNVVYKLSPHKYEAIPIFVSSNMELYKINQQLLVMNSTRVIEAAVKPDMKISWNTLAAQADFIFNTLHGGAGENGCVQGMLDMLGKPYNGSGVFASALCMDKYKTNNFLRAQGFDVPQNFLLYKNDWKNNQNQSLETITQTLSFPIIIKPHDDGCSVLVAKAKNSHDIIKAVEDIFLEKEYALLEECIIGMELTVGVVGNEYPRALPPSQAVATQGVLSIEEKFLPGAGENQTPAPLPASALAHVQKVMELAYKAVTCQGYVRIDCFYQDETQSPTGKERVVMLEFNTLPALTPATALFHQAAEVGISPTEFIDMIIELGCAAHQPAQHKDETTILQLLNKQKDVSLSN